MKIAYLFLGFCLLLSASTFAQNKEVTIVIDPGHGGTDPGHLSGSSTLLPEKTLNLNIAMYLGGYIEKYLQNVNVIYTRKDFRLWTSAFPQQMRIMQTTLSVFIATETKESRFVERKPMCTQ